MAKETRVAWPIVPARTIEELKRRLDRTLPLVQQAIDQAAVKAANEMMPRVMTATPKIIAFTDTTVTVAGRGIVAPLPGDDPCRPAPLTSEVQLRLTAMRDTALVSGPAVGVLVALVPEPQWVFQRPAPGTPADVTYEMVLGEVVGDQDIVLIPSQGEEINLTSAVRVIAATDSALSNGDQQIVVVTVTGEGPNAPTEATLTVTSWQGVPGAAPAAFTGALPFQRTFTIARPEPGNGIGRVVWRGTATAPVDALSDADAVDVAEAIRPPLNITAQRSELATPEDPGGFLLTVIAEDPAGKIVPDIAYPTELYVDHLIAYTPVVTGTTRVWAFEVYPMREGGATGEVRFQATSPGRVAADLVVPVPAWRYPGGGTFEITAIGWIDSQTIGVFWQGHVAPAAPYPPALPEGTRFIVTTTVIVPAEGGGSGNIGFVSTHRTIVRTTTSAPSVESVAHDPGILVQQFDTLNYTEGRMRVEVAAFYDGAIIDFRTAEIVVWVKIRPV